MRLPRSCCQPCHVVPILKRPLTLFTHNSKSNSLTVRQDSQNVDRYQKVRLVYRHDARTHTDYPARAAFYGVGVQNRKLLDFPFVGIGGQLYFERMNASSQLQEEVYLLAVTVTVISEVVWRCGIFEVFDEFNDGKVLKIIARGAAFHEYLRGQPPAKMCGKTGVSEV